MSRFCRILAQAVLLTALLGCNMQPNPVAPLTASLTPTICAGNTITLADISDDPDEVITNTQPLANYLAERLAPFGISCGRVKVAKTVGEMIELINSGQVDIYFDSLFPATLVSNATGAQPILRRWRNCDPEYYSVIFATKASGITSVDDLRGRMIAMDRPDSTSGFVMPAAYLMDHGLKLVVKEAFDAPVSADEVGVYFAYDDVNTHALVLEGKVSAGATDDFFYGSWEGETPGQLVKLAETGPMLRQVVLVGSDLGSDMSAAIKEELLKADANPVGLAAMKGAADTCRFDDKPGSIAGAMEQMQEIYEKIKAIPGWQDAYQKGK